MKAIVQRIERFTIASAFSFGLIFTGIAASATATGSAASTTTNVAVSGVDVKDNGRSNIDQANAEARRMLFRNQGMSR